MEAIDITSVLLTVGGGVVAFGFHLLSQLSARLRVVETTYSSKEETRFLIQELKSEIAKLGESMERGRHEELRILREELKRSWSANSYTYDARGRGAYE